MKLTEFIRKTAICIIMFEYQMNKMVFNNGLTFEKWLEMFIAFCKDYDDAGWRSGNSVAP